MKLALHFESKPARPKYQLLRRLAYQLLGPHKTVDSIIMPTSDAGKSTLGDWLLASLPGLVALGDATVLLSNQGVKFTAVGDRLARFRLVVLDEADKLAKPLSSGALNTLTSNSVTIEHKGGGQFRDRPAGQRHHPGREYPERRAGPRGARADGVVLRWRPRSENVRRATGAD